jgi:hypothetical protein
MFGSSRRIGAKLLPVISSFLPYLIDNDLASPSCTDDFNLPYKFLCSTGSIRPYCSELFAQSVESMSHSRAEDSLLHHLPHTSTPLKKILNTVQLSQDYSVKPAGLRWRSNTIFIISTVAVGLFTDLFLYGLIVPVLPFMLRQRVGLPEDQIQSHVSGLLAAYAGASVLGSPLAGYLADKVSTRQSPFLGGLLALLLATILLFVGRSVAVLTIARVFQGVSAAMVWTIGLALCLETVGPENLGKTIGSVRKERSFHSVYSS